MSDWRPSASIEHLKQRAELLAQARAFFAERDVTEVQTPVLAKHSVTEPDVQSIEVPGYGYLQTSPEYQMKRLLAAGMPSCYQLGPAFRHGEQGRLHNPEFTMLEWYRLGFDHNQAYVRSRRPGGCHCSAPNPISALPYEDVVGKSRRPHEGCTGPRLRRSLASDSPPDGFFITDYPADQAALARINPDGQTAARFELVIDGVEIANGYWELLDAEEHRQRFKADSEIRQQRGLPAMAVDEAFLAALKHGLPECAGVALGFDRLVMLGGGAKALADVTAFRGS
jgi:lysyl-tRNA synthetase class 2